MPEVLRHFPVAQVWISPAEQKQPTAATRVLESSGVPITVVHTGQTATMGEVQVVALAPQLSDGVGEGSTGLNDASIVTLSTVDGVTVLGLGDLEHAGQRELASRLSSRLAHRARPVVLARGHLHRTRGCPPRRRSEGRPGRGGSQQHVRAPLS